MAVDVVRSPCPKCYDTGVYYQPIGPDGELLQPMVCPYHQDLQDTKKVNERGGGADAR